MRTSIATCTAFFAVPCFALFYYVIHANPSPYVDLGLFFMANTFGYVTILVEKERKALKET